MCQFEIGHKILDTSAIFAVFGRDMTELGHFV
jgi:hypothetical protein